MKIVLDTNVLVSGLLNPFGSPAEIVRMGSSGNLELCFDARIVAEYREVLLRPKFKFKQESVEALLNQIEFCGHLTVGRPLSEKLIDPDDEVFLEIAIAARAEFLVTGNLNHYPRGKYKEIKIVSPGDFLNYYRKR